MQQRTEQQRPARIAILLEGDRHLNAYEALADDLCRRGHAVHLAVQGDTVKDRDGALGRLGAAHLSLTVGQAPTRRDRWSSLLKELHDRIDPLASVELDGDDDDRSRTERDRAAALTGARLILSALPACPDISTYLRQLDLDLLILTPHTSPWSGRLDYLLAARRLGLPVANLIAAEASVPARPGLEPLLGEDAPIVRMAPEPEPADIPAATEAIERALSLSVRPRAAAWPLRPLIEIILGGRGTRRFLEDRLGADMRHGVVLGVLGRAGGSVQDGYARWIFPNLLAGLLALLPRRRDLFRDLMSEQLNAGEMSRLGWVEDAIATARRGGGPILLGPWVGGVGHEVLYWIPMLRWFRKYYQIDKDRIVVISRGGVRNLYTGVLGHYLDVFDLVPNKRQEYRDDALRNIVSNEMPMPAGKIEKEIYNEAARLIGAERYNSFHPQILFKLFKRRWGGIAGDTFVERYTRLQPVDSSPDAALKRLGALPPDYVAVNFHFSDELPDTASNRAMVTGFIDRLAEVVDVYLIEPCIDPEMGPMADIRTGPRVHRIEQTIRPSEILGVQSGIIAGARALVGTFGGMTYLAQALGREAVGVRASDAKPSQGTEELGMIRTDPAGGGLRIVELDHVDQLIPALAGASAEARAAALGAAAATIAVSGAQGRSRRLAAETAR